MEPIKSKPLIPFIFILLSALIFIRPFFSGLAYPILEIHYQNCIITLAIISLFINRRMILKNPYNPPILLLLLAYLISSISSVNIGNSLKETIKLISSFCVLFLVSQADEEQKKSLIKTIITAASIIGLYSIYQYFWGYQHTLDYLKKINSDFLLTSSYAKDILIDKRTIGTFPSPNIFGGYLLINLFFLLHLLFELRSIRMILFKILPLVAIIFALILTKSLGVWLSLTLALIVLFLSFYKFIKHKKSIILLFTIFIFFILSFILFSRRDRLIDLQNSQNSITQRLNYWQTTISIIKDHPILGVGPGNFKEVFLKYKVGINTGTRYAHNIFLHQWSETGILGLLGIVFLVNTFIIKSISRSRYLFLAGLAFIFHNLIDITYFIPEVGIFWWVLLALTL